MYIMYVYIVLYVYVYVYINMKQYNRTGSSRSSALDVRLDLIFYTCSMNK